MNEFQLFIVSSLCSRVAFQRKHLRDLAYAPRLSLGWWTCHGAGWGGGASSQLQWCVFSGEWQLPQSKIRRLITRREGRQWSGENKQQNHANAYELFISGSHCHEDILQTSSFHELCNSSLLFLSSPDTTARSLTPVPSGSERKRVVSWKALTQKSVKSLKFLRQATTSFGKIWPTQYNC